MFASFIDFIKKEVVLVIALSLAIITSLFSLPKLAYIDFKVLILLFNLMIVVAAFKQLNVLDTIAILLLKRCGDLKKVSYVLIFITFFASMFITNDVALITFVPLTLVIAKKTEVNVLKTIVFQTLAANLGSALTPMGNPQNLFLYSYYNLSFGDFIRCMLPVFIASALFLILLIYKEKNTKFQVELLLPQLGNRLHIIIYMLLFVIILLSVFRLLDYRFAFIVVLLSVLLLDHKLFTQIDYSLLLTFVGFFIFVGNLSNLPTVKTFMEQLLSTSSSTYFASLAASQVISNVPATMLLAPFTTFPDALLLGVNIGGMGTLIASLASVISYKLFTKDLPEQSNTYLFQFTLYNFLGLLIFIPFIYLLFIR